MCVCVCVHVRARACVLVYLCACVPVCWLAGLFYLLVSASFHSYLICVASSSFRVLCVGCLCPDRPANKCSGDWVGRLATDGEVDNVHL